LPRERLSIYLNDHLAGSTVGLDLARRIARQNSGNEYGRALQRLSTEIAEDREALKGLMERLGVRKARVKIALASVTERLGRLKPNDQLTGYSPLSRLIELETLTLGVMGKLELWRSLADVADRDQRLDRAEIEKLAARAERQRDELMPLRRRASLEALVGG
jgi:hypothetical protein